MSDNLYFEHTNFPTGLPDEHQSEPMLSTLSLSPNVASRSIQDHSRIRICERTAEAVYAVYNFPCMSDYRAYENKFRDLYASECAKEQNLYVEGSKLLEESLSPWSLASTPIDALPYLERKVAFTVHSLAAYRKTLRDVELAKVDLRLLALSGISAGIASAAVAAGSISLADYVSYLKIVTPYQVAAKDKVSLTLKSPDVSVLYYKLRSAIPELEIVKFINKDELAIYAPASDKEFLLSQLRQLSNSHPVQISRLRQFPAASHSKSMQPHINAIVRQMHHVPIKFKDPLIPLLSSSCSEQIVTANQVCSELLAVLTKPIDNGEFAQRLSEVAPAIILETGNGQRLKELATDNNLSEKLFSDSPEQDFGTLKKYVRRRLLLENSQDFALQGIKTVRATWIAPMSLLQD
ncbi:MAG: hypothetical protein KDD62_15555, partial [Bdellovibrionales bacterium]|nr:hypothetical protein [Bdellovibrionales bacterium]